MKINKIKLMTYMWNIGAILEFVGIPLHLASMYNISITYDWFIKLREFEYIEITYYIVASITALIFAALVNMNGKMKRWKDMGLAFFCFSVQIGMMIWLTMALVY